MGNHGVAHAHGADYIYREQRCGRVGAHVLEANGVRLVQAAGRVHQNIDSPVRLYRMFDKSFHRRLISHINLMGGGPAPAATISAAADSAASCERR
jgi:hypothetical protein